MCAHESLANKVAAEPNWDEVLEQIQVMVARRADGFFRAENASRETDRELWARAESEVLGFTTVVEPVIGSVAGSAQTVARECCAA